MENLPTHIRQLLTGHALGELNLRDQRALGYWMDAHPEHRCLLEAIEDKKRLSADLARFAGKGQANWKRSYKTFEAKHLPKQGWVRQLPASRWYWAAASILILVAAGLSIFHYYAGFKRIPDESIVAARPMAEVLLSNGSKIQLGNKQDGIQAGAPGAAAAGQLLDTSWYRQLTAGLTAKDSAARMAAVAFKIVTPRGGKYALSLPDGSRVWMSAASSLSYRQNSGARQVEMEGEVYFEIAKQPYQKNGRTLWRPFKVHAKDMTVEVWGTKFTVASYPGIAAETATLFEGKVKVSTADQSLFLSPGQRADLKGGLLSKQTVDNSQGAALKEGYFVFKAATLSDILSEVGNWYNVNIVFEDDQIAKERFEAMLPRTSKLADLLGAIQSTGNISFKFRDRTIYVDKK